MISVNVICVKLKIYGADRLLSLVDDNLVFFMDQWRLYLQKRTELMGVETYHQTPHFRPSMTAVLAYHTLDTVSIIKTLQKTNSLT